MHCRIGDGMKHSKLQLQVLLKTIVALVEFTITRFSACTRSVWGLPSWSLALSKLCDQNSKGMQHCQGSFSAGSTYIALLVLKYLVQVWHPEDWVCNEEWTKKAGHDEGSQGLRNGQVWWLRLRIKSCDKGLWMKRRSRDVLHGVDNPEAWQDGIPTGWLAQITLKILYCIIREASKTNFW